MALDSSGDRPPKNTAFKIANGAAGLLVTLGGLSQTPLVSPTFKREIPVGDGQTVILDRDGLGIGFVVLTLVASCIAIAVWRSK